MCDYIIIVVVFVWFGVCNRVPVSPVNRFAIFSNVLIYIYNLV